MTCAATAAVRPTAAAAAAAALADSARRTDSGLGRRRRAGDPRAWRERVERFSGFYAIVGCFDLNGDRAQDAHHDVFTRMYPRLHTLADPGALKPWIARLARRVALDRLRLDARELPSDASTFELLTEIELAMAVREALDCLDESSRAIGEALGLPPGTVASRISRGLVMLRRALEEEAQPAAGGDIVA
jgi:DNA-directed RNA polymerase specialized sigma24 family protein